MAWRPFSAEQEEILLNSIREAERNCSGEIRIHIDQYCKGDPVFKARNLFGHLKMTETELHNGVLIYVAIEDRKFCILGDEGIHQAVTQTFWDATRDAMLTKFSTGHIIEGISDAVLECGRQLKNYFPYQDNDQNELPDEISYDD